MGDSSFDQNWVGRRSIKPLKQLPSPAHPRGICTGNGIHQSAFMAAPATEVFKNKRWLEKAIQSPWVMYQFIADLQIKKPPEGGFGIS